MSDRRLHAWSIVPIFTVLCLLDCSCKRSLFKGEDVYWERDIEKATTVLSSTNISVEERSNAMIDMARAYHALGQTKKALGLWRQVVTAENTDAVSKARAKHELGSACEQEMNWERAIEYYQAYVVAYAALSHKERENFDFGEETGEAVQFHVGDILDKRLGSPRRAEIIYTNLVACAKAEGSIDYLKWLEGLGDFYVRQKRYEEAIVVLEEVRKARVAGSESGVWSPARPEYKIMYCLVLLNKKAEAKERYAAFMAKWGKTSDEFEAEYVEKARDLMQKAAREAPR